MADGTGTQASPFCMSAKHEQAIVIRQVRSLTSLKYATLQAGVPAVQSLHFGF